MLKYLDGPPEDSESEENSELTGEAEDTKGPLPEPQSEDAPLPDEASPGEASPGEVPVDEADEGSGRLSPDLEPAVAPDSESREAAFRQKISGLEQRIGYLERIVKISQILNSTLSLKPLLTIIVQAATELTDTEASSIILVDKNTQELRFAEATGGVNETLKNVTVPLEGSIGGWVVRANRPLLIRDAKNDPRWHGDVDETSDFHTESLLGVPLKVRDRVIGVLEVVNKTGEDGFTQDDVQIAETLAAQAAIAIENARLMDELQQAYRELSEVDRIKGDFVSIASHELRTPLSLILGYATFLKESVTGQASEQADIVLGSAIKLRSLIDDMVNLRHVQTGDVQVDFEMFSLREMVLEIVKEFSEFAKVKQQALTTRFTPNDSPLNIEADRTKLHLILANLVSNATKFTGEEGRIHIDVELKGHEYWINVIDTGIGIPESEYDRIFGQFYQTGPSLTRKFEGMGLGLSIAKGMVDLHKGRIWVESVVGKGSKFTLVLPTASDVAEI